MGIKIAQDKRRGERVQELKEKATRRWHNGVQGRKVKSGENDEINIIIMTTWFQIAQESP